MRLSNILAGAAGFALVGFTAQAQAQDPIEIEVNDPVDIEVEDPNAPQLYSTYGASITVGGGVVGFTDDTMRDVSSTGGAWDARLVFGTREFLAVEAAYSGAALGLDALGLDDDAILLSSGGEVLARVNFLRDAWQPYVVGGIGYRNYSIVNNDRNTSSIGDDENLGEVPLGAGVSYRYQGLVVDARGMFRAAFNDDLVNQRPGEDETSLHTWQGQITAGWEF